MKAVFVPRHLKSTSIGRKWASEEFFKTITNTFINVTRSFTDFHNIFTNSQENLNKKSFLFFVIELGTKG